MNQIIDFFERKAVPDKEHIADSKSDLVWQKESNADVLYSKFGENSRAPELVQPSCLHEDRNDPLLLAAG